MQGLKLIHVNKRGRARPDTWFYYHITDTYKNDQIDAYATSFEVLITFNPLGTTGLFYIFLEYQF